MVDPSKRYNEMVKGEEDRLDQLAKEFERQEPMYGRQTEKLSPEEVRQDYQVAAASGETANRLQELTKQYGKRRGMNYWADWVIENENA